VPALSFSPQFASLVESGQKTQTIRAPRKRPIVWSDRVYLYTGMRTKACRKLGEGLVESVEPIVIAARAGDPFPLVWIRSIPQGERQRVELAIADGFPGLHQFGAWFCSEQRRRFEGSLIRWRLLPREEWKR
jgi:hypothetical protein